MSTKKAVCLCMYVCKYIWATGKKVHAGILSYEVLVGVCALKAWKPIQWNPKTDTLTWYIYIHVYSQQTRNTEVRLHGQGVPKKLLGQFPHVYVRLMYWQKNFTPKWFERTSLGFVKVIFYGSFHGKSSPWATTMRGKYVLEVFPFASNLSKS